MKFDIEWLQHNDLSQRQDIFYCEGYEHSPVCFIKGNGRKVLISCDGEMRIIYKVDGDDVIISDYWDLIDAGVKSDDDIWKLKLADWDCNPWFDAYDVTEGYHPENGVESFVHLDMVEGNLDDIIDTVKQYIRGEGWLGL